jgi:hypothetical protein
MSVIKVFLVTGAFAATQLVSAPAAGGKPIPRQFGLASTSTLQHVSRQLMIKPGEEILVGNGRRFRVLDVVPFEERNESPFLGCYRSRRPRRQPLPEPDV